MKKILAVLSLCLLAAMGFSLNVAVVAGDAIGDRGFTDMAYKGIQDAANDFDIEFKFFECHVDPSKYYDALRAAALR
ncbi:MAG: BMP family ABC transporter substrate-binding protein, partial [Petrotogales bacterium]